MQQLYAIHGSAVHTLNENHTDGNMLSEERLADNITSGKFDLYGEIVDINDKTLGDYKITSSFKLMKALGYYKVDVPTGEVYKTGLKKGQPKTRKEWRDDGVRHVLEWAIQLNYYRILLEQCGFKVSNMVIQAMCRDYSLRIAAERNIRKPVYLIPINRMLSLCIATGDDPEADAAMDERNYGAPQNQSYQKPATYHNPAPPTNQNHGNDENGAVCVACGKEITPKVLQYSLARYKRPLCMECQKKEHHAA